MLTIPAEMEKCFLQTCGNTRILTAMYNSGMLQRPIIHVTLVKIYDCGRDKKLQNTTPGAGRVCTFISYHKTTFAKLKLTAP